MALVVIVSTEVEARSFSVAASTRVILSRARCCIGAARRSSVVMISCDAREVTAALHSSLQAV